MRRRGLLIYVFVFLLIFFSYQILHPQKPGEKLKAVAKRVIDGDTLVIYYQSREETLRLIGIDTPEMSENEKVTEEAKRSGKDVKTLLEMGKEATLFVRGLVKPDDQLTVELDVQLRDGYSRLLGYVFLKDGRMLNEEILRAGYAEIVTIPPNVKYIKRLYNAYLEGKENRRGFWKECITAAEARNYVGEVKTVCGFVASTKYAKNSKGKPTFLNIDKPYPNQIFTVLIWDDDRNKFPGEPEKYYSGKTVCVTGQIIVYRGIPEIILRDPSQIRIVKPNFELQEK